MQDKLVKYGIIQSNVCPLCTTSPENIDHLYFECEYAKHMWAICQQVSSLENEARLIMNQFKSKTKITALANLVIGAVVWHVWKEKYLRISKQQKLTSMQRFQCLRQDILVLTQGIAWKDDKDAAKQNLLQNWVIPVRKIVNARG